MTNKIYKHEYYLKNKEPKEVEIGILSAMKHIIIQMYTDGIFENRELFLFDVSFEVCNHILGDIVLTKVKLKSKRKQKQ